MSIIDDPALRAWEATVHDALRGDALWRFHAYRVALYLLTVARGDVDRLVASAAERQACDQLLRATASISANIAEGYGRSTSSDRARFYDIALGSLREALIWYDTSRRWLAPEVVDARMSQLAELRRILIGALKSLREMQPGTRMFSSKGVREDLREGVRVRYEGEEK